MTRKSLLILTAAILLTGNAFAAAVTQFLKLTVTENSNVLFQQPFAFLYAFSVNGNNGLDANDMGNQNSIGNPGDNVYPFSLSANGDIITQQDARPTLDSYKKIQLGFISKNPATIKVLASAFGNTPSDSTNRPTYAWIEQISTGYIYYFFGDTCKLDIPANLNYTSDFCLHTGPPVKFGKTDATCFGTFTGDLSVDNPNCTAWKLDILLNSSLIFSDSVFQADTTIEELEAGTYTILTSVNSVTIDSTEIVIGSLPEMIADFTIDNYTPTTEDVINFTDYSVADANDSYSWTFGDGGTETQTGSTSYQYSTAGVYEVVLTITSVYGCQSTVFDSVHVSDPIAPPSQSSSFSSHMNTTYNYTTYSPNSTSSSAILISPSAPVEKDVTEIYAAEGQRIMIAQNETQLMSITVMNVNGQIISTTETTDAKIEVSVPATGIYIVRIINAKNEVQSKTIMVIN